MASKADALKFEIAILDNTKADLSTIKSSLESLQSYANSVSRAITNTVKSVQGLGKDFKLDLPNISGLTKELEGLTKTEGKLNAFKVDGMKKALKDVENVVEEISAKTKNGGVLTSGFQKAVKSMNDALSDVGNVTPESLYSYRVRVTNALNSIKAEWNEVVALSQKNGGLELFPKAGGEKVLQTYVQGLRTAFSQLQSASQGFLGAMDINLGTVGRLQTIIDKISEVVNAYYIARQTIDKNDFFGAASTKANTDLQSIIEKLGELERQLQQFGTGNYGNVMQGFLDKVSQMVNSVQQKLGELSQPQSAASQHDASAQAIKGETEAQKQLNEQIKQQEIEVQRLTKLHDELATKYGKASDLNSKFNIPAQWDAFAGRLNNKEEVAAWVASFVKKNGTKMGDFYNLDDKVMQQLLSSFEKKFQTLGNAKSALKGLINEANIDFLRGSTYNTSFGQNNAQIRIDEEALKSYRKAKREAAEEEKRLDKETDDAYRQLMSSKARLNQLNQQAAQSTNQSTEAKQKETAATNAQAQANERAAATANKKTAVATEQDMFEVQKNREKAEAAAKDILTPFEKIQERIGQIIATIQSQMKNNLTEVFNTDISATKTIQQLNEMATSLGGLKDLLSQFQGAAKSINEVTVALQNMKTNLAAVQKGGSAKDSKGDEVQKQATDYKALVRNINIVVEALDKVKATIAELQGYRERIRVSGGNTTDIDAYIDRLNVLKAALSKLSTSTEILGNSGLILTQDDAAIQKMVERLQGLLANGNITDTIRKQIEEAVKEIGSVTPKGVDYRQLLEGAKGYKQIAENAEAAARSQFSVDSALAHVNKQLNQLRDAARNGAKVNVDTTNVNEAIATLQRYQRALEFISKRGGRAGGVTAESLMATKGYQEASAAANRYLQELKGVTQANKELANSENTVAQAIANASNAGRQQSQVLSDLKSMAAQYLSVWGAQQFISDMTNITGELELQERSLEVILGNASAAREMYSQIRDLSQMSPYTFEDLLKSHRQLAAFGIEAKDIFGTLKSLSDIGAGLDVDVSRLILAYGHTKSYGYLSGIQNRQFETAGIDLVGALTDMYNRRADNNKKLGIASDYVTRADMFKRMRARSIPFSDVEEVIMDLDKPGGKFYNMQIKQYDTLGGKLRNLRNNYRIMMSEIGESNHGLLAGTVDAINELTANWQKYGRVLKGIVVGYGAMKVAALVAGNSILKANKQIMASAIGNRSKTVATTYLNNPTSSWFRPNMSAYTVPLQTSMSNGEFRNLKTSKDISNITKQRIALTGKLTEVQRAELLVETGVNQARATQISQFSGWKRGLMSIRLGFIQAGAAVKAFTLSLLTNPMTWIFAAVGAITAIKSKLDESSEAAREFADNLKDAAKTDQEGIRQSLSEYDGLVKAAGRYNAYRKELERYNDYWGADNKDADDGRQNLRDTYSSDIAAFKAEAEARGIENVFEDLRKKLETASPFYQGDYFDIMKASDELDQLGNMVDKYQTIQHVKEVEEKRAPEWETRNSESTGEGFKANAKDYSDARKAFVTAMENSGTNYWTRLSREETQQIYAYANAVGEALQDTASRNRAIAGWFAQNGSEARLLSLEEDRSSSVVKRFRKLKVGGALNDSYSEDFKKSAQTIVEGFVSDFQNEFAKDADGMSEYFTDIMNKMFSEAKVSNPQDISMMTDEVIDMFYTELGNKVSADDKKQFFTNKAQGIIGDLIQKNMVGKIDAHMADKDVDAVVKNAVAQAVESFKEQYPKLAAILKVLGVKLEKQLTDTANNIADKLAPSKYWQRRALAMKIEVNPQMDVDYTEFINGQRKALKTAENILNANKKKIQYTLGVNVSPDFEFVAPKDARKYLDKLTQKRMQLTGEKLERQAANKNTSDIDGTIEFIDGMIGQINKIVSIMEYLDSEHQSYSEDKNGKDEDKAAKAEEARKRAAEKARNEREKAWREEDKALIRDLSKRRENLSKAYSTYWDWYERLGHDEQAAMAKVREMFTTAQISNEDLKNLQSQEGYINLLLAFIKQVDEEYKKIHFKKENKDTFESMKVQASDTIDSTRQKQFDDAAKKYTSELDLQIKRLEKQYDLYKKIYELTGDRGLAVSLSGRSSINPNDSKADDVKKAIQTNVSSAVGEFNRQGAGLPEMNIDFGSVFKMSDEQITSYVGKLFNETENNELLKNNGNLQQMIAGIVEKLKVWRDLQEQINNESRETYAELVGGMATFANSLKKADEQFDETMQKLDTALSNGDINGAQYNHARDIADARRSRAILEASPQYKNLLAGNTSYKTGVLQQGGRKAIRQLTDMLNNGTISAEEYSQKIEAINNAMEKLNDEDSNTTLSTFINDGWQGVLDRRLRGSKDEQKVAAQNAEKAASDVRDAEIAYSQNPTGYNQTRLQLAQTRSEQAKSAAEEANQKVQDNEKASASYKKFSKAVSDTIKVMGDLNNAVSLLSNVFDSLGLGDTGFGQATSDASDIMGGMLSGASSLSALGPWGMAAGAGLGLISGLAGVHDKHQQQKIDKLQEDVSKIEGYAETISKAQERTLGYSSRGSSSVISGYQKMYADTMKAITMYGQTVMVSTQGAAGIAMADYYNSAGSGKDLSTYEQQYNMLVQKRQDYIDMYNAENGKKKKSNDALQEYKEKIAELDDEIRYFSEDLANTLYGIDLKSWADQLGDALMTAFENGEDAAEAFDNSVTSILQGLVKKMVSVGIFEPLFERLRTSLFGTDGKGGSFNLEDPNGSKGAWMADINEALGDDGYIRKGMEGAGVLFDSMEELANKYGNTLLNSNSASMSSSVKGITEQTADLLAAYLNAIRADVSVMRQMQSVFFQTSWPDYIRQITSSSQSLSRIDSNVLAIRQLMSENGILYERVNGLYDDLHSLITQKKQIKIA